MNTMQMIILLAKQKWEDLLWTEAIEVFFTTLSRVESWNLRFPNLTKGIYVHTRLSVGGTNHEWWIYKNTPKT